MQSPRPAKPVKQAPPVQPPAAPPPAVSRLLSTPAGRPRVGRNEPCPCGSGKKAKQCHPEWT
ncbi:SEC-C metal-binding domain-containing protein [Xanthomonas populi]